MKYRAVFTDPSKPKPERPDQTTAMVFETIKAWAVMKLEKGGTGSYVEVFQTSEQQIHVWNTAEKVKSL